MGDVVKGLCNTVVVLLFPFLLSCYPAPGPDTTTVAPAHADKLVALDAVWTLYQDEISLAEMDKHVVPFFPITLDTM